MKRSWIILFFLASSSPAWASDDTKLKLRALNAAQRNPIIAEQLEQAVSFSINGVAGGTRFLKNVTFLNQDSKSVVLIFDFDSAMINPKYNCFVQIKMRDSGTQFEISPEFALNTCK